MSINIRQAHWPDRFLIWLWRNDPVTRRMEHHDAAVPWDGFKLKFRQDIEDRRRCLMMAERRLSSLGVGQVVFNNGDAVMGINLNPACRGQGLAAPLIELFLGHARRQSPFHRVLARIRSENTPSRRAFARAGFEWVEENAGICVYARDMRGVQHQDGGPNAARQAWLTGGAGPQGPGLVRASAWVTRRWP